MDHPALAAVAAPNNKNNDRPVVGLVLRQQDPSASLSLRSPNPVARSSSTSAAAAEEDLAPDRNDTIELLCDNTKRPAEGHPSPPPGKFRRTSTGDLIVVEEMEPSSVWQDYPASMEKKKAQDKEPQDQVLDEAMHVKPPASNDDDCDLSSNPVSTAFAASPFVPEDLERQEQEEFDLAVALSLQEHFNAACLVSTSQGRAWDFVYKVASNHHALCQYDQSKPNWNGNNFKVVPTDDLVFCVARLLDLQAEFRSAGRSCTVDIGFHYTTATNMLRIRYDGLLTKAERDTSSIEAESRGATFGDGIYTSNNPYSYHAFGGGDHGLVVARLKGSTEQPNPDTVLGRKGDTDEVCVLQQSSQCAVLVQFHADLVSTTRDDYIGNEMVHAYHCSLQAIVDECFNDGAIIPVSKVVPSGVTLRVHASQAVATSVPSLLYRNPQLANHISLLTYTAPETLVDQALVEQVQDVARPSEQQCHICLDSMTQSGAQCALLRKCSHQFHRACIEECLKYSYTCPVCRSVIASDAIQGTMPSGTVRIEGCPFLDCTGFKHLGSIKITYEMQGGVQKVYHVNPGVEYEGTIRIAYVPDTDEGRALVKRLQYAFQHGLTFTVGTSLATGQSNRIIWASIHHKTSTEPGPHGFPDPGYFFNANEELDALHVPSADQL